MNLIQSLQADLGILDRLDEADEVVDRSGKLTDDIGERHHHTQRHIAMNDVTGCNERNENISGLAEENGTRLLKLTDGQPFHADAKKPHLHTLPLPALLTLTVVELDVLHSLYQLNHLVAFGSRLAEALIVQFTAI